MSLKAWKAKYYPAPAAKVSKADAIAHGLRKWRGLRPAVLKRYELSRGHGWIGDDAACLDIDMTTCALCKRYYRADPVPRGGDDGDCCSCPLMQALGRPCDGWEESPYSVWLETGNPELMIAALEKAQRQARKKAKR